MRSISASNILEACKPWLLVKYVILDIMLSMFYYNGVMIEWMQASVMTYKLPVYCSQHWLWHTHIYITETTEGF